MKTQVIMEEDWDNLIILDACRFDYFEKFTKDWNGHLEKRKSLATRTEEWLLRNFVAHYDDIVYVTANPVVSLKVGDRFHRTIPVWDFGWSVECRTVLPDEVTIEGLKARHFYNKKRIIIHYIQPHEPYINLIHKIPENAGFKCLRDGMKYNRSIYGDISVHDLVKQEIVSPQEVKVAYEENVKWVLSHVQKLVDKLKGHTVITADHGEALGENGIFSHPKDTWIPCLYEVPWFVPF